MSMPERGTVAGERVRMMGRGRALEARMRVLRVLVRGEEEEGVNVVRGGWVVAMWVRRVERVWRVLSWLGLG